MGYERCTKAADLTAALGPLAYTPADPAPRNPASRLYDSIVLAGNALLGVGNTLASGLSALDEATLGLLIALLGGDPQLGQAANDVLGVTPIGWPGDAAKLAKLGRALKPCKAAKGAATAEQCALEAVEDGLYPVMKRGFEEPQGRVWLSAGDVWKYGATENPATRYSQSFLDELGLRYEQQLSGTLQQALSAEKASILNYLDRTGRLPPGNKIIR